MRAGNRILAHGLGYFFSRINGEKGTPISNSSGAMNPLTVWPHGSFLFLISIRYPRDSRCSVAFSTLSTSNSSNVKLEPSLWYWNVVRPGILAKAGLGRLRKRPQRETFCASENFRMKIAVSLLCEGDTEELPVEFATFGHVANDWTKTCDEKNLYVSSTVHGISSS